MNGVPILNVEMSTTGSIPVIPTTVVTTTSNLTVGTNTATPLTPEILNSVIAMTNPLEYSFPSTSKLIQVNIASFLGTIYTYTYSPRQSSISTLCSLTVILIFFNKKNYFIRIFRALTEYGQLFAMLSQIYIKFTFGMMKNTNWSNWILIVDWPHAYQHSVFSQSYVRYHMQKSNLIYRSYIALNSCNLYVMNDALKRN